MHAHVTSTLLGSQAGDCQPHRLLATRSLLPTSLLIILVRPRLQSSPPASSQPNSSSRPQQSQQQQLACGRALASAAADACLVLARSRRSKIASENTVETRRGSAHRCRRPQAGAFSTLFAQTRVRVFTGISSSCCEWRRAGAQLAATTTAAVRRPPPLAPLLAVRSIEDCIGISSSQGKAPVIPKRCADRAALLEACIESKQELASERTSRCSGAQPIPKPAPPAQQT